MDKIKINGQSIEIEKKYYKNILVKLKNNNKIFSIGCIVNLSKDLQENTSNLNLNIVNRFYKIYSFQNEIPFDYVNIVLKKIFSIELVNKILFFYLKDDISFRSVKKKNSFFTFTMKYKLIYDKASNNYQTTLDNIPDIKDDFNSKNIKQCSHIASILTNNILKLLKSNKNFEINKFFYLTDKNIEYCFDYYINSTKCGWGMYFRDDKMYL